RRPLQRKSFAAWLPNKRRRVHAPECVRHLQDNRRVSLSRSLKSQLQSCLHGKICRGARHCRRSERGFPSACLHKGVGFVRVWSCQRTSFVNNLLKNRI